MLPGFLAYRHPKILSILQSVVIIHIVSPLFIGSLQISQTVCRQIAFDGLRVGRLGPGNGTAEMFLCRLRGLGVGGFWTLGASSRCGCFFY